MSDKEENSKTEAAADLSAMLGIGGLFDGVSNLISKFGELAEKGESLSDFKRMRSGSIAFEST